MNNKTLHHNNPLRFLLRCAALIAVMMAWTLPAKAQTDYSGVYYIANAIWNGSNTNSPYYWYNENNTEYNWYLVPGADPHRPNKEDAWYSPNYTTQNGDEERPFLTTYRTNRDNNSIWIIKKTGNYYYIIHALTGKYVKYEPPYINGVSGQTNNKNCHRKAIHLEAWTDPDNKPGAVFKYEITTNTNTTPTPSVTGFNIRYTGTLIDGSHRHFNPAGDNWEYYYGKNDKTPYSLGMVGLYSATADNIKGGLWPYEDAKAVLEPTIGDLDISTSTVTITPPSFMPANSHVVYTTNGTEPSASNGITYSDPIPVTATTTIKAAVVGYDMVLSTIASKEIIIFSLDQPTFETTCDNKLEIICSNMPDGGQIRYTVSTDGTVPADPTISSTLYEGPITLNVGDKVKAIAFYSTFVSEVSAVYTHALTHADAPTITLEGTTISISCTTIGATIHYTTDGTIPTISSPTYTTPFTIGLSDELDIQAIAKSAALLTSCVTRLFIPTAPSAEITTDACSETSPRGNVLTVTGPNDGRTFWYAVTAGENSAAPDVNAIPNPYSQYSGEVVLDDLDGTSTHYTVHAYAKSSDGLFKSPVVSESHQMKTAGKPVLMPPTGSSPVVVISGGVFGDVAVCSATGVATQNIAIASDGTAAYSIPAAASGTLTVSFKHGNWLTSCEATYTLPGAPETPTWSQDCANLLSLHCATPMADIHYTTGDNENPPAEPTLESLTYTTGCLDNLPFGTLVRAKAFIGFRASGELSFTYNPTHSATPQFFVEGTLVTISVPNHPEATIYYELSTNGDQTMPVEPNEATTGSTQYDGAYTLTGITIFSAIAVYGDLAPSCPVRAVTREGYSINSPSDLSKLSTYPDKYFFVFNDIDASGYTTTVSTFTGVIEGNNYTISNLTAPLINTATGAVIHDLTLDNVIININAADANAGAIACTANGDTRIYNCGIVGENSSVSGTANVGGLVGELDGSARVINCFSFADIDGGAYRGGIVGNNKFASTSGNLKTMVMNCMFYGDISIDGSPTRVAPVYGGEIIHNKRSANNNTGLNNYCYFYYHGDYLNQTTIPIDYHGSLGAEERFLNRFEFFRQTLNSTRNMAAYYISGDATETELVAKWVLDTDIAPYPILKAPGYYPSLVNFDAEHAVPIDPDNVHYNEGRKLGTLTVNIQLGSGGAHFNNTGAGVSLNETTLTLNVIDKDPNNFNFNYKKVQLPYYSQVGEGNYTNNRVVTGWKIVKINGSTTGTGNFTNTTRDYPDWNFVDRACSNKDLYSVSGRIFNQGAYWEVPDGVTSITIEPYWAKAVYLSDANYDVTYSGNAKYGVTVAGACPTSFDGQDVYNAIAGAIEALAIETNYTVYDYAVVLVGNYHQYATGATLYSTTDNKPVTFMSADLDGDCEPDYTLFYYHQARKRVAPIRFDFLNMPGVGMVKRTWDNDIKPEPGIFKPVGWFEITNTVYARFGQFEYVDIENKDNQGKLHLAPLILQGGIYEQFVSSKQGDAPDLTNYILVGGNAWFKNFANGCHTDKDTKTHNMPINVAGGDYENFYLSGIYRPSCPANDENAECYIDGGRFEEVAGAGMQEINRDVTWLINAADIEKFFGGGINPAKFIKGDVTTTISNSRVTEFYGGPKFGEMQDSKVVTTTAINCRFGLFFGAGHGGTAYNRVGCEDKSAKTDTPPWSTYVEHYTRSYEGTHVSHSSAGANVNNTVNAISTNYEYEYILHSDGEQTVARFFVNFASLSLASTKDVVTNLTGCTIGTFYGGGRLGAVEGNVSSTLTDCTVEGNVFGSGFSAETPSLMVMDAENFVIEPKYNRRAGVFNDAEVQFPASTQYYWKHTDTPIASITPSTAVFEDDGDNHYILTNENLQNLGAVLGHTTLTINGNRTVVMGDVYGGGALSSTGSDKTIQVNIDEGVFGEAGAATGGNIYGGGMGNAQNAVTEGTVEVNIGNDSQSANSVVINGNVYGCNNANGSPQDNVTVNIYKTKHNSSNIVTGNGFAISQVFGGGNQAHYQPSVADKKATVHVHNCDNTIQYVYGGGNAADVGSSGEGIKSATEVIIDGGRIEWLFGGGNGAGNENPGANIYGNTNVTYHAGDITYLFGGSNEKGLVDGSKNVSILNDLSCSIDNHIAELYGGNNKAPITGNAGTTLTMPCTSNPCAIDYVFGGSRQADISGDVELTIEGGEYDYVFGGNNISGVINGNVTLNLYGGTINNAFGGNKGGGSITGNITVNVEDHNLDCPLEVSNVFGAGDQAVYEAPSGVGAREFNPMVNINHLRTGKPVTGNVYGGGNGDPDDPTQVPGMVTGNPKVIIGDITEGHETYRAAINGNVYGGGNAAKVVGPTAVLIQKANSTVGGDIYGGGNLAHVTGATTVDVTGGTVTGDVYGGGALANVGTSASDITTVTLSGGTVGNIYGGGLGQTSPTSIAALVNGAVQVTVNAGKVTGAVYGCNNVNGAPQSTVKVDINGTDAPASGYALGAVFGGGNQAAYPKVPIVKVHNCDNSIEYVYGGGNAASVKGTDVTIYGGNTIGNVFGGCYGADVTTDGTDVKIYGGTILKVFGGNNQSGTITGDIQVNVDKQTEAGHASCPMKIEEVYGGGNVAESAAGEITIGCTGNLVALGTGEHYGVNQEGIRYVYGGANQADITGNITLNINSGIVENVFGGNNTSGSISGTITVNIEKDNEADCAAHWYVGNVYGGGNQAAYAPTTPGAYPAVNIKNGTVSGSVFGGGLGATAKLYSNPVVTVGDVTAGHESYVAMVTGNVYGGGSAAMVGDDTPATASNNNTTVRVQKANTSVAKVFGGGMAAGVTGTTGVTIADGTINGGVFGGCDSQGNVTGKITVNVNGGTLGSSDNLQQSTPVTVDVFGGGYGASTTTSGDVEVNINGASVNIYGDVYGGSALGNVNDEDTDKTTVNILNGTLHSEVETITGGFKVYHGGNVYGGGLGQKEPAIPAKVFGKVYVNIGSFTPDAVPLDEGDQTGNSYSGSATIQGNVYGCNNTNGSPQDDVTVNIYKTAHIHGVNEIDDNGYALANVFGGGNEADYLVGKTARVNVFGCDNTIERTFGGSNAAASNNVVTDIKGGRIHEAYGGGNGEIHAANINGTVILGIHGGSIGQSFSGSNQTGVISSGSTVIIDNTGCGGVEVEEHFCGGNFANWEGNIEATIECADGMHVKRLYGGCKQANVVAHGGQPGNVHLTVKGGTYEYIYGGSQGYIDPDNAENNISADIAGNVQLDIYGGTVTKAIFGGSHILGKIAGTVIVNVEDKYNEDSCPLDLSEADVYGGGNQADYPGEGISHEGEYNYPQVNIKNATVKNVFGGGLEAEVTGNPQIQLKNKAKVLVNVYGGGNRGVVNGNPKVILNGKQTN